ncbi:MAG: hypothetical protein QOK43_543 [Acidimicrobiaceae bacterium]|nr:hypothetical protein [Acidimicrobiaceae bacterium]
MSNVWERSDRALCTHPGWATLRGWGQVAASFFALFQGRDAIQFILTNVNPSVQGDAGWVSVDENILGEQTGSTVAALNLFVREGHGEPGGQGGHGEHDGHGEDDSRGEHDSRGWRMVGHHGSVVIPSPPVVQ